MGRTRTAPGQPMPCLFREMQILRGYVAYLDGRHLCWFSARFRSLPDTFNAMLTKTLELIVLISFGLATLSITSSAQAQEPSPGWTTDVGLAIGATAFPQRDELGGADVVGGLNPGVTATGSVGFGPAGSPFSYQIEVQYTRLGLDDEGRSGAGGAPVTAHGTASVLSGTGSVRLSVFPAGRFRPYLIGGTGVYRLSSNVHYTAENGSVIRYLSVPTDGKTRFGLNGGAGLEVAVSAVRTFIETRFHSIFSEEETAKLVPIVMGVRF